MTVSFPPVVCREVLSRDDLGVFDLGFGVVLAGCICVVDPEAPHAPKGVFGDAGRALGRVRLS